MIDEENEAAYRRLMELDVELREDEIEAELDDPNNYEEMNIDEKEVEEKPKKQKKETEKVNLNDDFEVSSQVFDLKNDIMVKRNRKMDFKAPKLSDCDDQEKRKSIRKVKNKSDEEEEEANDINEAPNDADTTIIAYAEQQEREPKLTEEKSSAKKSDNSSLFDNETEAPIFEKKKKSNKRKRLISDTSIVDSEATTVVSLSKSAEDQDDIESIELIDDVEKDFENLKKTPSNKKSSTSKEANGKRGRKKVKKPKDDDDDEFVVDDEQKQTRKTRSSKKNDADKEELDEDGEPKKKHKKVRKLLEDDKLAEETRKAMEAEKERLKRLENKKSNMSQEILLSDDENMHQLAVVTPKKPETPVKEVKGLILDTDLKTKKAIIEVDRALAEHLKDHQADGIKFMWDNCFESVERIRKGDSPDTGGCVLAHCMGLGKTLQVISLLNTVMRYKDLTLVERILVFTPINALENWKKEFSKWQRNCKYKVKVFDFNQMKQVKGRLNELRKWNDHGGVFLVGYQLFTQLLTAKKNKKANSKEMEEFEEILLKRPDLVVCDEGHLLKNDKSATTMMVSRIRTRRRIVLTGTPLQNNLNEYYTMVNFVKPNLLGNFKEFRNRFVNPIESGQHADSSDADVRFMKKRAHVLCEHLKGTVQRKDYTVILPYLPKKHEYVLYINLTELQQALYRKYLESAEIQKLLYDTEVKIKGKRIFEDFHNLSRTWSHPWAFKLNAVKVEQREQRKATRDFINDDEMDDEYENYDGIDDGIDEKPLKKKLQNAIEYDNDEIIDLTSIPSRLTRSSRDERSSRSSRNETIEEQMPKIKWWNEFVTPETQYNIELSGKMMLLKEILLECYEKNDKLLLFSQSLDTLDLVENFLGYWSTHDNNGITWIHGLDYCRIDGSVDSLGRSKLIEEFNDKDNDRLRFFLISTRAGGMGINLVGANRVIIFDVSWNPSNDSQSIYRVFRFGQNKPVYIYRFVSFGTMEQKIYQRQVNKVKLSRRVCDALQQDRHYTAQEVRELYDFKPWDSTQPKETPLVPEDRLLSSLLQTFDKLIVKYHEHDSLLENKFEENLTEEERLQAWNEFKAEEKSAAARKTLLGGETDDDLRLQARMQEQQHQYPVHLTHHDYMNGLNSLAQLNMLAQSINPHYFNGKM